MKVEKYINKLKGENLQDALVYSLFALEDEDLKEVMESFPEEQLLRLESTARLTRQKQKIRAKFEDSLREAFL